MSDGITIELDMKKFGEVIANTPGECDAWLRSVAQQITDDIVLSFGTSPSPAGGPPGVDTGALRASMHWYKVDTLSYAVSDGVEYGQYQELVYDRPFMTPAFETWRNKIGDDARRWGLIK